jgi:thiamine biosynthesis protein ThiS
VPQILLNGETHEIGAPLSVTALLEGLGIDTRRVAVERNLVVVRRAHYDTEIVSEGDEVEIVNFVGGG